jgi:hypothetical protein
MRAFFILILVFGFLGCSTDSNQDNSLEPEIPTGFIGELDWIRNFGGSGEETAQAITATSDGGFAILGYTNSSDGDISDKITDVNDYWLLKLDAEGNLEWNKTYGGSKDDRGQSLTQTQDGGYILTGYAMSDDGDGSSNQGFHDNWILKLDASGNMEWEKSFGFSGHDHSYDIIQTQDGGFFFIGFLDITAARADGYEEKGEFLTRHGVGEFWGTKIDAQGNLQWRRYFGGTNNDRAHAVVQSNDGGFVMAGFSESDDFDISNTKGSYDFWVVKISDTGDLVWERSLGGSGIEISYDIAKTNDNSYVITGNTFSDDTDVSRNHGESDIWLIKLDDDGNLIWEKSLGGTEFDAAQGVFTSLDGGFLIAGNSKSSDMDANVNWGENDLWVLKTDANGELDWQQTFGGSDLDYGFDVVENADSSIIVVGESASADFSGLQNKGMSDVIVIKIK